MSKGIKYSVTPPYGYLVITANVFLIWTIGDRINWVQL